MRIAITGSTGLLGGALSAALTEDGHEITRVSRQATAGGVAWDPSARRVNASSLESHDAVIHLAGASIAGARWTEARKRLLRESRVAATAFLSETLAALRRPPALLICASAVGYYGNRPYEEQLDEQSAPGSDFLAELCRAWEAASAPAREAGIRVLHLRFGVVLSPRGGFLAPLLPLYRLGLGGKVGSGTQALSWISIGDVIGGVRHLMTLAEATGPYNFSAPACTSNAEFAKTLARVLRRPALFTVPAAAVRLAFGEMGNSVLLSGQCAVPSRLLAAGYRFQHASLADALRAVV